MAEWFDPQLGIAVDLIRYSKNIVALTGAGISTASGIADFRSAGGLWEQFNPLTYANYNIFLRQPEFYWDLERAMIPIFGKAKPNKAHKALVDLEKKGKLKAIITQNIDNFHQAAGSRVPIIELHGNINEVYCMDCDSRIKRGYVLKRLKAGDIVPVCPKCGGRIKPNIVLFNEPFADDLFDRAQRIVERCDLLLVLGTSLQVYPANQLPALAKQAQAKEIFINFQETLLDKYASVRLLGNLETLLPLLINDV